MLAAISAIHLAVLLIIVDISLTSVLFPKASATDPIIIEIDGISMPAIRAPIVPTVSIKQSRLLLYLKNL